MKNGKCCIKCFETSSIQQESLTDIPPQSCVDTCKEDICTEQTHDNCTRTEDKNDTQLSDTPLSYVLKLENPLK